jgi:hypothetical protein
VPASRALRSGPYTLIAEDKPGLNRRALALIYLLKFVAFVSRKKGGFICLSFSP